MKTSAQKTRKNLPFWDRPIFDSRTFPKYLPFLLLIVAAFSGILPQPVVAGAAVAVMFFMAIKGNIFLAYPIVVFYYIQLDKFFGVSVFRIFTLLFLFSLLLYRRRFQFKEQLYFLPLAVYVLYVALTLSFHNVRTAAFFAFDVVVVVTLIFFHLRDKEKLRTFFTIFVLTALVAFLTGLIVGIEIESTLQSDVGTTVSRVMATFNDPNYMGFFYSTAIFATITLGLFKKQWRIVILIALYIMMLASLSITAIIGNILFWALYLLAFKKMHPKNFLIIIAVIALLVGLYFVGLSSTDIPVLGDISLRIQDKLGNLAENNLNSFTTNRLDLAKRTLDFFLSQTSFFRIIFGGHLANTLAYDMPYGHLAAHNDYADLLLNVGLLGTIILVGFTIWRVTSFYSGWRKTKEKSDAFGFMVKIIWLYYTFTLTLFGDARFLLFYFF